MPSFDFPRRARLMPVLAALVGLSAGLSSVAVAQETRWGMVTPKEASVPAQPDDPTAAKAYVVLDRLCAQCHQSGKLTGLLPGQGIGNILDIAAVARDATLVLPGNPDGSRLYTLMQMRMPPHDQDAKRNALEIGAADLEAVRDWITGLKRQTACPDRAPITPAQVQQSMAQAVAAAPPESAKSIRFLSLSHLHNACAPAAELKTFRYAATVAANSLSWGLRPAVLEPVDADGTLLKFDLAAIGWDEARWERLLAAYPYGPTDAAKDADAALQTRVVRADWFAASALKPPLYYDLLGLPDRLSTLQTSLKIDQASDIALNRARRIGIRSSQVARGSRLLQRLPFANGSFWTSYEYAPTPGRPDLFDAPGGPGSRGAPKPDAALSMFTLPAGYNAFYISNGDGLRVNDLPASVIRDESHPSVRISAGVRCMACHERGPRPATDEIRARVQGDTAVPRDIREKVLALHPGGDELKRLIDEDIGRTDSAITQSGLIPGESHYGNFPVAALAQRYERDVSVDELAVELDVPVETIRGAASRTSGFTTDIVQRIVHGPVPRRQVEMVAAALRAELGGKTLPQVPPLAALEPERTGTPLLTLKSGATAFKSGEPFTIRAQTTENCYLTLINIDRNGRGTVVYPNDFEQNNYLEAGKEVRVPADGAPYLFRLREPGRETIVGICQTSSKAPPGISHDFERQRFTELGEYRAFLNRMATNDPDGRGTQPRADQRVRRRGRNVQQQAPTPTPLAPGQRELQARTAIQIDVLP